MAVLTIITLDDGRALAAAYGLGDVRGLTGIAAGSVNSNFALDVGGSRVFLRLYEERDAAGARREAALLERIARAGVPTPPPLRRMDGDLVSIVRGKPAAVFPWRDGTMRCQKSVTTADAKLVGEALAKVHVTGAGEAYDTGRFGLADLLARVEVIAGSAAAPLASLAPWLREALERTQARRDPGLPSGLIHGDLFRDNVLWDARGGIAALLDFESACFGPFVYDLMVAVLSWCVADDLETGLATAMREGYESVRPLTERERLALAAEGCFAALRFSVTRITDYAMRDSTAGPRVTKDWRRFTMRFEKLQSLGVSGVRRTLGA